MLPGESLSGRITRRLGSRKQEASRGRPQEEEDIDRPGPSGGRSLWAHACSGGTSCHRIGKRARRPPQAGLGGSPLEGRRPRQGHEGGAWAPRGGVLRSTFPSRRSKARRAKLSGVRQQGHSGATGVKSHERRPPPTSSGSSSRQGWWAARLHRHTRAQPSRLSGAPLVLASGACGGPPHSYVRMPYGLPNAADTYQRLMRGITGAREARRSAALAGMEMAREEPPTPPEPPEAPGPGGS